MAVKINGVKYAKPRVNGVVYNAFVKGQQVWKKSSIDSYIKLTDGTIIEFNQGNAPIYWFDGYSGGVAVLIDDYDINRIQEISFGNSYNDVTAIPSGFLLMLNNLEKVDLKGLSGVTTIEKFSFNQLSKLKQINLSHFPNLELVVNGFLGKCTGLTEICIGDALWENVNVISMPDADDEDNSFFNVPNTSECKIYASTIELGNEFKSKFRGLSNWTVSVKDCNQTIIWKKPSEVLNSGDELLGIKLIAPINSYVEVQFSGSDWGEQGNGDEFWFTAGDCPNSKTSGTKITIGQTVMCNIGKLTQIYNNNKTIADSYLRFAVEK